MKKTDLLFVLLAIAAISMAVAVLFRFQQGTSQQQPTFLAEKGITVVGIVRESDCIDCIEKLVCQWNELESHLRQGRSLAPQFVLLMGYDEAFDPNELEALCDVPDSLQMIANKDLNRIVSLPHISPSVGIFYNGRAVSLDPVFVSTDMRFYQAELQSVLANLEAGLSSQIF